MTTIRQVLDYLRDEGRLVQAHLREPALAEGRLTLPVPLGQAGPGHVSFLGSTARDPEGLLVGASPSLLLIEGGLPFEPSSVAERLGAVAVCDNARLAFIQVVGRFYVPPRKVGIHPTAVIAESATLGRDVFVGPLCTVGEDCVVGDETTLHAGVHLYDRVRIGRRVTVHSGTVIGAEGFGYERAADGSLTRFPHIGGVVIEDDVEIGSNTSIDRGTLGDTVIARGARVDNQVHVAHNTRIGEDAAVIAQAMIGGSTTIGDRAWIAPSAVLRDRIRIEEDAVVGLGGVVTRNVPAGATVFGSPARPSADQRRLLALWVRQLEDE